VVVEQTGVGVGFGAGATVGTGVGVGAETTPPPPWLTAVVGVGCATVGVACLGMAVGVVWGVVTPLFGCGAALAEPQVSGR
jgi:hypothetical protein